MLNSVQLQGNLARDPEIRFLPKGTAVCEFTVAHNEKRGQKETVSFIGCVAWEGTAELIANYFKKGSQIIVEGSLRQETWDDKTTGKKQSKTKVNVSRVHFCGSKSSGTGVANNATTEPGAQRPQATATAESDDVPF